MPARGNVNLPLDQGYLKSPGEKRQLQGTLLSYITWNNPLMPCSPVSTSWIIVVSSHTKAFLSQHAGSSPPQFLHIRLNFLIRKLFVWAVCVCSIDYFPSWNVNSSQQKPSIGNSGQISQLLLSAPFSTGVCKDEHIHSHMVQTNTSPRHLWTDRRYVWFFIAMCAKLGA